MKILDNFLSPEDLSILKEGIFSNDFPWYYTRVLGNSSETICDEKYNFQFFHSFYDNYRPLSDHIQLMNPFINLLKPKALLRIKANLTSRTDEIIEHGYHCDQTFSDFTTGIYYLNTNDGYTKLNDGTKINSVENRFVLFDGSILHTGTTCTNSHCRVVINFNFI
jgi:hypothetical protein